jgi:hypothetical protein
MAGLKRSHGRMAHAQSELRYSAPKKSTSKKLSQSFKIKPGKNHKSPSENTYLLTLKTKQNNIAPE